MNRDTSEGSDTLAQVYSTKRIWLCVYQSCLETIWKVISKKEIKNGSHKNDTRISGFSSPRAFQWWSRKCRSPSGWEIIFCVRNSVAQSNCTLWIENLMLFWWEVFWIPFLPCRWKPLLVCLPGMFPWWSLGLFSSSWPLSCGSSFFFLCTVVYHGGSYPRRYGHHWESYLDSPGHSLECTGPTRGFKSITAQFM